MLGDKKTQDMARWTSEFVDCMSGRNVAIVNDGDSLEASMPPVSRFQVGNDGVFQRARTDKQAVGKIRMRGTA